MESKKPTILGVVIEHCNKNFKKEHEYNRYISRSIIKHYIEEIGYSVLSYDKIRRKLELAGYLVFLADKYGSTTPGYYRIVKEIPTDTTVADLDRIIMRKRMQNRFGL